MFEDSLVESRISDVSSSKRWTAIASIGFQFAIAGVVLTLPLLHPEALPFRTDALKVTIPLPPKPSAPTIRPQHAASNDTAIAITTASRPFVLPSLLPSRTVAIYETPRLAPTGNGMGAADSLLADIGDTSASHGPTVFVTPAKQPAAPLHISSGVSQGMLLTPIRPVYPAIARSRARSWQCHRRGDDLADR